MSFNYLASQVPVPVVPTSPPLQSSCTDTTTTAATFTPITTGSDPFAENINKGYAQMAAAFGYGAGSYAVMDGMTLTVPGSGLDLPVAAGHYTCMGVLEYAGGTVSCADNTALVFVWGLQDGSLTTTVTTTVPAPNCVYIGNCTTSAGNITAVDYTGVCYCQGGIIIRTTADRSAPADTPTAGTAFLTKTGAGTYHFNGSEYSLLQGISKTAIYAATLTGDLTLIPQDNKVTFNLVASGGNRTVFLPDPSTLPSGWLCPINNVGASNSIIVKDFTGVTTYSTNTTTNRSVGAYTYTLSGSVIFPAGAWGPGSFPVPGPVVGPVS